MDEFHSVEVKKWKDKSDEELLFESGRIKRWETAPVEMMRRLKNSMLENKKAIDKFNAKSSILAKTMIGIALLQIVIMIFQILIMVRSIS
jgi:hypothetical protein